MCAPSVLCDLCVSAVSFFFSASRPLATLVAALAALCLCGSSFFGFLPSAFRNGGGKGIRTPDLLIANETLYQLSYAPVPV